MKKTKLSEMKITHVSYVRKGANNKEFFLMKSDEQPIIEKEIPIFIKKSDEEKKLVYGIVYEPDIIDAQGEYTTADEIEKAAHQFLMDSRNIDFQHNFKSDYGNVVESYIAQNDCKINNTEIKKGSWVLVTKADDEVWKAIKNGEITGYSMGGIGTRMEVTENIKKEASDTSNDDEYRGFFNVLKSFFSGNKTIKNNEMEENKLKTEDRDIKEIAKSLINDAIKPINEKLEKIEKQYASEESESKNFNNEKDIELIIKSVSEELIKPINERLSKIEKLRGISHQQSDEINQKQNQSLIKKSIFSGIEI